MAKATAQDLIDAGFRAEQFGTPADFSTYVTAILEDAAVWAASVVGASAYAAATGVDELRIKRAEIAWTRAELWRRRAAFVDSNASSAFESGSTAYLDRREFLAHAAQAEADAQYLADMVVAAGDPGAVGGGVAMGYAETGPFPVST